MIDRHKVIVASKDVNIKKLNKMVVPYEMAADQGEFVRLFKSHNFGCAIFFSQRPEENKKYCDDLKDLERILRLCSENDIKKLIYISSTSIYAGHDIIDDQTEPDPVNSVGVVLTACENLCEFYKTKGDIDILVLHTPCLFGEDETSSIVGEIIAQAVVDNEIILPGNSSQVCDYLSQDDLGELILRAIDDEEFECNSINLCGGQSCNFGEMANTLKLIYPEKTVTFSKRALSVAPPVTSNLARKIYDFVPVKQILFELDNLLKNQTENIQREKKGWFSEFKTFFKRHSFVLKIVELIIGFFIMELLNWLTKTSVQFQFIDFRLLYVVLLASIHGMKTGLCASVLASLSCLFAYISKGSDWRIIVYNVDNWLPFACFIIVGAIVGYTKDRWKNDFNYLKREHDDLEQRYIFLNELYGGAVDNKSQYKMQIMSYKDSFGRIFEVTKKLDSVLPDHIFQEALNAIEDILQNQTVCIYTIQDNNNFGRLVVCSKKINNKTDKSLNLSKFNLMTQDFEEGEVWSNKERYIGYPEYAAPIYRNGQLVCLIIIKSAKFEQMAMYYQNLFKVLCGLVQVALLRAIDYNEETEQKIYIPGTKIMKPERFKQVIMLKEEMQENAISEYSILRINSTPENRNEIAEKLSHKLRYDDVIGLGEDGEVYLVLSQTNKESLQIVVDRLKNSGISFD